MSFTAIDPATGEVLSSHPFIPTRDAVARVERAHAAHLGLEGGVLERMLDEPGIQEVPFGEAHWREAVDAFRRRDILDCRKPD